MTISQVDPNAIAADVTTQLISSAAEGVANALSEQLKRVHVRLRAGFKAYIEASLNRCSSVKTLLHPDEAVPLFDIYVPLEFTSAHKNHKDIAVIRHLDQKKRLLVVGTAGGGKSMFLRRLNIYMLEHYKDTLPLYYELRALNASPSKPLLEAILEATQFQIHALTMETLEEGARSNRFAFILDGFDEINYDQRDFYAYEINQLALRFPNLQIVVTTRPEDRVTSLQSFTTYHANPMSKAQTVSLLEKLEYDQDTKKVFIDRVRSELYDKHKDFLSNPLLASMMLLTFSQYSDIPDKIHIFYQQAFEVLFQRHDRSKGAFTRRSYTDLPIDEFQRVFAYFCASSYAAETFSFGDNSIREYVSEAIAYEQTPCNTEHFLRDVLESTCLLHRDGPEYSFVHRSFQEYFTAVFIARLNAENAGAAINSIIRRSLSDSVIGMVAEINRDLFERAWAIPTINSILTLTSEDFVKPTLSAAFMDVGVDEEKINFFVDKDKKLGLQIAVFHRVYPKVMEHNNVQPVSSTTVSDILRKSSALQDHISKRWNKSVLDRYIAGDFDEGPPLMLPLDLLTEDDMVELGLNTWLANERRALQALADEITERLAARQHSLQNVFARQPSS